MKLFDSELQYLSELYQRLGAELAGLGEGGPPENSRVLVHAILRNRELFSRIEQMNSRVFQLAREWEKFRQHIDPLSRKKTRQIAENVQKQAAELSRAVEQRMGELEASRIHLEKELAKIHQGSRYLESLKPIRNNYPKFIDSLG